MLDRDHWPHLNILDLQYIKPVTHQLHQVVQLISTLGKHYAPHCKDDSHTNMGWDIDQEWMIGIPLTEALNTQLAIHPVSMRLVFLQADQIIAETSFLHKTQQECLEWIIGVFQNQGISVQGLTIDIHYDLPDHPVANGGIYEMLPLRGYQGFSKLKTIGKMALTIVMDQFPEASSACIWPHHFDLGTYIPLVQSTTGEISKSITVGMAIADQYSSSPYLYLNPWTANNEYHSQPLPQISGPAFWHQKDFISAFLKVEDLLALPKKDQQIEVILRYFEEAMVGAHQILNISF